MYPGSLRLSLRFSTCPCFCFNVVFDKTRISTAVMSYYGVFSRQPQILLDEDVESVVPETPVRSHSMFCLLLCFKRCRVNRLEKLLMLLSI
jgi:hypothetical protein